MGFSRQRSAGQGGFVSRKAKGLHQSGLRSNPAASLDEERYVSRRDVSSPDFGAATIAANGGTRLGKFRQRRDGSLCSPLVERLGSSQGQVDQKNCQRDPDLAPYRLEQALN